MNPEVFYVLFVESLQMMHTVTLRFMCTWKWIALLFLPIFSTANIWRTHMKPSLSFKQNLKTYGPVAQSNLSYLEIIWMYKKMFFFVPQITSSFKMWSMKWELQRPKVKFHFCITLHCAKLMKLAWVVFEELYLRPTWRTNRCVVKHQTRSVNKMRNIH